MAPAPGRARSGWDRETAAIGVGRPDEPIACNLFLDCGASAARSSHAATPPRADQLSATYTGYTRRSSGLLPSKLTRTRIGRSGPASRVFFAVHSAGCRNPDDVTRAAASPE